MPDFYVLVPRPFTVAEREALERKGTRLVEAGDAPPAISLIPGRSILFNAEDEAAAREFVLSVVKLSAEEAAQLEVWQTPHATE
jgi:hypothetical protein